MKDDDLAYALAIALQQVIPREGVERVATEDDGLESRAPLVIPREGVERQYRYSPNSIQRGYDRFVIPREGVEKEQFSCRP